MNRVDEFMAQKLQQRTQDGNLRQLTIPDGHIDFLSNDYLGFATSGLLINNRPVENISRQSGSTGSRLLSGNSIEAEKLEKLVARFHYAEGALLFNSGYDANMGLLSCIASRDTTILYDELCHASLIDGIRLSQCTRKYKFRHNDVPDLEEKLKKYNPQGPVIVVVESIYSMDGDMAPLQELVNKCEQYQAQLIVDEAHATGIFGTKGEGLVCALNLQDKVFARVHTFGKALGCHGAVVVGSNILKQYLVNFARSFIYTTALPLHAIDTIRKAYELLSSASFSHQPLHELISYFRSNVMQSGINGWKDSLSPIQILVTGNNEQAKLYARTLQEGGIQVKPILHPTVPQGEERLRICLHTFNTRDEIDPLFTILNKAR